MRFNMTRVFHPVGQGAFYSEQFCFSSGKEFNIVYDCGSMNTKARDRCINFFSYTVLNIDILFISHFHADHINGINKLLKKVKNIKKICLPLLTDEEKLCMLLEYNCSWYTDEFILNFIINPIDALKKINKEIEIIQVEFDNEDDPNDPETILFEELGTRRNIKSSTNIKIQENFNWIFKPYNYKKDDRFKLLMDKLKKLCTGEMILENGEIDFNYVQKNWKNISAPLTNAYKSISGGMNQNSMTIYSGPLGEYYDRYYDYDRYYGRYYDYDRYYGRYYDYDRYKVGCLYTGDYNAKSENKMEFLNKRYSTVWNNIGTIQIPHHGSYENYNENLIIYTGINSVISTGYNYGHPNISVVNCIIKKKSNLNIVDSRIQSAYIERITTK